MGIVTKTLRDGKSIRYMARVFDHTGKAKTKTFKKKKDATAWHTENDFSARQGHVHIKDSKQTFGAYCQFYVAHIKKLRGPKTVSCYEIDIKNHLDIYACFKLIDIKFEHGVELQEILTAKGLANRTNNKIVTLFKQILEFSTRGSGKQKQLGLNPLREFEFLPEKKTEMNYWNKEEAQEFLSKIKNDRYYLLYLTAFSTGMRLGELAALTPGKIDFRTGMIKVSHSLKWENSKLVAGPTKNKGIRFIPMSSSFKTFLRQAIKDIGEQDYIFTSEGSRPIAISNMCYRFFTPLQKQVGVKKILRFHDIRHSYASIFMMGNGNILALQKILGHKDLKQIIETYAHLSDSFMKDSAEIVRF